jgi:hypothetical protein
MVIGYFLTYILCNKRLRLKTLLNRLKRINRHDNFINRIDWKSNLFHPIQTIIIIYLSIF